MNHVRLKWEQHNFTYYWNSECLIERLDGQTIFIIIVTILLINTELDHNYSIGFHYGMGQLPNVGLHKIQTKSRRKTFYTIFPEQSDQIHQSTRQAHTYHYKYTELHILNKRLYQTSIQKITLTKHLSIWINGHMRIFEHSIHYHSLFWTIELSIHLKLPDTNSPTVYNLDSFCCKHNTHFSEQFTHEHRYEHVQRVRKTNSNVFSCNRAGGSQLPHTCDLFSNHMNARKKVLYFWSTLRITRILDPAGYLWIWMTERKYLLQQIYIHA